MTAWQWFALGFMSGLMPSLLVIAFMFGNAEDGDRKR